MKPFALPAKTRMEFRLDNSKYHLHPLLQLFGWNFGLRSRRHRNSIRMFITRAMGILIRCTKAKAI